MGGHEIKKLLTNKRNGHQMKEVVPKKIFPRCISNKGLITIKYKELKKLNSSQKSMIQ
jgi:hypothetical protein